MNRQNILKTAIMLAATLLIAACTNDEMADSQPETLPEGMYPLTFTATQADIVASPQTRVTDSDEGKSKWTANDQIKVKVSEGGNAMETTCTLNENGNITGYDPQLYWKTTQTSKINAWYSNIKEHNTTNSTVNLANQSDGLAYVLKADEMLVDYKSSNIPLQFKHQLAKVRVKLEKRIYKGDLTNATVKMKGYTSCSVTDGAVTVTEDSTTGYITMRKATYDNDTYYEANVVPGTILRNKTFEISLDGQTTEANLKNEITLTKGNVHTITLAIDNTELTEITGGGTINSSGDYIMTGEITETVTLNGEGINLILKDVNVAITGQNRPAIEIKGGSPVITVVGKNNVLSSGQWGGIILENGASIEIVGTGKENSSLTVTAGNNGDDKASTVGIGAVQYGACGNISISNVNLTVSGANSYLGGSAAIGTSAAIALTKSACGNITITDAIIDATSGSGAAAIGLGCTYHADNTLTVGDIKITGSEIVVKLKPYEGGNPDNFSYGAGIGMGIICYGKFECGTITIDKNEDDLDAFTKEWVLEESNITKHNYKIGKGYEHVGAKPQDIKFGGVKLIGKDLSDGWGMWSVP